MFHKTEVLGVTFNGENVIVHGDIHVPHKMVLEEFMQAVMLFYIFIVWLYLIL